jgi:Zn finger protein HypA/HybF involved in hydrogenase expression
MSEKRKFECLRCDHRFMAEYDRTQVVERACPKCGSNSVRLEPTRRATAKKPAARGG